MLCLVHPDNHIGMKVNSFLPSGYFFMLIVVFLCIGLFMLGFCLFFFFFFLFFWGEGGGPNYLFFEKSISGIIIPIYCQTVRIQIRPDILSGLIWVQTVRRIFQQTTLVGKDAWIK